MNSVVFEKSKKFAVRIVGLYQYLNQEKKEYTMAKQILRCGTSIGANIAEAQYGITRRDFANKLYVALKECAETHYWLELLFTTKYIEYKQFISLRNDCEELLRMLSSATKTLMDER